MIMFRSENQDGFQGQTQLALGACLFALNFAGCSTTGSCGGTCGGQRLLAGNIVGQSGCSGCSDSSCTTAFSNKNYGGQTGLGLGLMEAGPSCDTPHCNGGCQSCQRRCLQLPKLQRPHLASRLAGRLSTIGCGCGGSDPQLQLCPKQDAAAQILPLLDSR